MTGESPIIMTQKKELSLVTPKYCESIHETRRRKTCTVTVRLLPCHAQFGAQQQHDMPALKPQATAACERACLHVHRFILFDVL